MKRLVPDQMSFQKINPSHSPCWERASLMAVRSIFVNSDRHADESDFGLKWSRCYAVELIRGRRMDALHAKIVMFVAMRDGRTALGKECKVVEATESPLLHTFNYSAPHYRHITQRAISIVQQSQVISLARPMPKSCLGTILRQYSPKYNQIAAHYDCAKYALISFAAYTHFQATKSPVSEQMCMSHANIALKALQKEIDHFGPSNADAIIVASIALTGSTNNWGQWAVFIDGYSKTLKQMKDLKYKTIFPDLVGHRFQFRKFSSSSDPNPHEMPKDRDLMRQGVSTIMNSISNAKSVIGLAKWHSTGFGCLETLARSINSAVSLENEVEAYHQLAWLRSWMFWIDLRQFDDSKEEHMLTAHFYGLLLAVVPIFPARYQQSLAEACRRMIQLSQEALDGSTVSVYCTKVNERSPNL
ncbi:uncharacterized protein LY89DRAFT_790157 [Mollisia scopiformis]|uniref:Uncharacterized protein n=1 Tax=Mollisia scopiformis TaxID=149040 RepID=A0A132B350_MOLSC|nr:uncharacterized protein LY89DRAFT_790157 [Mollisia scopiformis]KUJ06761.1 hypothetical protein LY89DRAFT_790157 [Mollisia scopiformis]